MLYLLTVFISTNLSASTLQIHVVDETGHPIWARIEVRGQNQKMYFPADAVMDRTVGKGVVPPYYKESFVIQGQCQVGVPPGEYRVIGEHGLEYSSVEKDVTVTGQENTAVTLRLQPWIRMAKLGWWSGELHIHRPEADAKSLVLAEDLNFGPIMTAWVAGNGRQQPQQMQIHSPPQPWEPNSPDLIQADATHFATVRNAEDERWGGAWLFMGLRDLPPGWGASSPYYPLGLKFVQEAHEQRSPNSLLPWFDIEKPYWWEVPVMMALAKPDSFEVLTNHFMQYQTMDNVAWGRPPDPKEYQGLDGWFRYTLDIYYHFLNLGVHVPASAGTASGVMRNPVGYNRVYVKLTGPFSVDKWFEGLHEGKNFVTNGPMIFFNLTPDGSRLKATVEAVGREPLDRIEIVADGKIIHWFPAPPGTLRYKADFVIDPKDYSWIAARCFLRPGLTIRLAHTSPVYLKGHADCRPDAQFFVNWMNDLISLTKADTKRFSSDAERDDALKIYDQALAFYEQKLQQGCGGN
jgi:hypothetical protein